MKKRDFRQLATKTVAEMEAQLVIESKELAEKRLSKRVGKLADLSSLSRLADSVARLKTALREQELLVSAEGDKE